LRTARLKIGRDAKAINVTFFECQSRPDLPPQIHFGTNEKGGACVLDDSGKKLAFQE
jgi:hypothetical protein